MTSPTDPTAPKISLLGAFLQGVMFKKVDIPERAEMGVVRSNLEGFAIAIAMALLLKQFYFDTFTVPTGSMEPTIVGRPGFFEGDRLLVDRACIPPERYAVTVFRYPLSRLMNYVKRTVGMPGESVKIWKGQVFVKRGDAPWAITRKPYGVQEGIFRNNPVTPPEARDAFKAVTFFTNWEVRPGAPDFPGDGTVAVTAGKGDDRWIASKFRIDDRRRDVWAPSEQEQLQSGPFDDTADLRLACTVTPAAGTDLVILDIVDPVVSDRPIRAEIGVEGGSAPTRLVLGFDDLAKGAAAAFRLPAGRPSKIAFDHVDGSMTLRVDGAIAAEATYEVAPVDPGRNGTSARARFGVRGGKAVFAFLDVRRDTYYRPLDNGITEWKVPDDHWFMMGDNPRGSLDSRGWRKSRIKLADGRILEGDAEAVSDRPDVPRSPSNPFPVKDAGEFRFVDTEGNLWNLKPGSFDLLDATTGDVRLAKVGTVDDIPDYASSCAWAPFVPGDHLVGSPTMTFWPPARMGFVR